ncbi:hypothetical protein IU433_03265 [Nocardia puris]|uniref:hypothetical protein n=1 Tax=Nocardia puris TaxID=208602 RepID=UPI001894CA07|nr:hypothetical protein [Nocardia puris]MBF6210027.1 hypothetical protein [Nocardia puris]MBF6368218.1 hypothetical protein [Nocardia puris]MBF6458063.1 hypothetical protein [Nocardia puris]
MSTESIEPADIPAGRDPALDRLDFLVGTWETSAHFRAGFLGPGAPELTVPGRSTFEWVPGRHFLTERSVSDHPDMPDALNVIGYQGDDVFVMHTYDSRGVTRTYRMKLDSATWIIWRFEPGFSQRWVGAISDGGDRVSGAYEISANGEQWTEDFPLTYRRVG